MKQLLFLLPVLAIFGWGCAKEIPVVQFTPIATSTGPGYLDPSGLSPEELTSKLNLAAGSVVSLNHAYASKSASLAREMKLGGATATRDVVIKRFAPQVTTDIEWTLRFREGKADQVITGNVMGADLAETRSMLLPAYWMEGEQNALSTGLIWVSQQVYENLSRSRLSTFDPGLLNPTMQEKLSKYKSLTAALKSLTKTVESSPIDVYVAKADKENIELPLVVNGSSVKVKAIKAKSWFGEFAVLDNPQNPLVLYVHLNELKDAGALNGLSNYDVKEIKDAPR